jgi:hypothetical protein
MLGVIFSKISHDTQWASCKKKENFLLQRFKSGNALGVSCSQNKYPSAPSCGELILGMPYSLGITLCIMTYEKFSSVCGGHFKSIKTTIHFSM